jgi:hypothetical protein
MEGRDEPTPVRDDEAGLDQSLNRERAEGCLRLASGDRIAEHEHPHRDARLVARTAKVPMLERKTHRVGQRGTDIGYLSGSFMREAHVPEALAERVPLVRLERREAGSVRRSHRGERS